jgi:hypothetical protein
MAATVGPEPVQEVFYSYAHKDADLRDELERHLSTLKRSGVIHGWHDREIDAGAPWAGEIHERLDRANVILLLISADFLASDYCYDVEMKRALERHEGGEAIVIPIILRPVDWSGAPFAKLQCLPAHAVPVTSWANRDEAFRSVAEGIRRAILKLNPPPDAEVQERALDAAMPGRVPVGESAGLLVMVRRMSSGGLKAFLRVDESYEISDEDVHTKPFRMEFSRDRRGELTAQVLTVRIETNDFALSCASKQIPVPPAGDSDACVFLVAAKREGRLQLAVEVLHEGVTVAWRLLRTDGRARMEPAAPVSYVLASLPLTVYAHHARAPGEFTQLIGGPAPPAAAAPAKPGEVTGAFPVPAGATPQASRAEAPSTARPAPQAAPKSFPVLLLLLVAVAFLAAAAIVLYFVLAALAR